VRNAIVAGQFYEDSEKKLREQIKECFEKGLGVYGEKKGFVKGVVSPHAGYVFSGIGEAYCFKEISESEDADLYLVLGFSHQGFDKNNCVISLDDWETPLGVIECDKEFGKKLVEETSVINDENVHKMEHSIEVQLPFLQFVKKNAKFIAMSVGYDCDIKKVGKEVRDFIKKTGKKVCVIASSDFTHFGNSFGYSPFKVDVKDNLKKLDLGAVKFIEKMNSDGFLEYCEKTGATICGKNTIALLIEILGKGVMGELLNYYTSGDVTGDYGSSVSYVSMVFRKF